MTRLPISVPRNELPATVAFSDLAIAAGMAGSSVSLCFRDYPASFVCELWRRQCLSLSGNQVYHVRTAADVRKLNPHMGVARVVLVHHPRLHSAVGWELQFHSSNDGPKPAVFTASASSDLHENPHAMLVLDGNARELRVVEDWLMQTNVPSVNWSHVCSPQRMAMDGRLETVCRIAHARGSFEAATFQQDRILRGLLAGACVLRLHRSEDAQGDPPSVNLEDYEIVRRLLQSGLVCPLDGLCDPLSVDMINRANVYLAVKYGPTPVEHNPFNAHDYDAYVQGRGGPPRRELVSRKEILDLGNTRSRMVRNLVEYLQRQEGGFDQFVRMGLYHRRPNREQWGRSPIANLIAYLRPWTFKQVRLRFDRLHKERLISGERDGGNGPWLYALPEELSSVASPFRLLPSVDELASGGPGGGT